MLEKIINNTEIGDFILSHSHITGSLARKIDPHYTSFRRECARAIAAPELEKKIAGYAGALAVSTLYCTAEIASRTLELATKGTIWAGKKGIDYVQHSKPESRLKLAAGFSLALLGTYALLQKKDLSTTITNTNTYVLTVNSGNTGVLRRLGWLQRTENYAIFSPGWQWEMEMEMARRNYGVLVLTGHHGSAANYLYGDRGEEVSFDSLPASDAVQAVIFSACRTAVDSEEAAANIYAPLREKFSQLKLILGFTGTSLVDDGVIPQVILGRGLLRQENGLSNFADYAIGVNPGRVGAVIQREDGSWEFRNSSRSSEISYLR